MAGRARRLGDLARVDLRSPASVDAQIQRMRFGAAEVPADELKKLPFLLPEEPQADAVAAAAPSALHKLELRIHSVSASPRRRSWARTQRSLSRVPAWTRAATH
ncbi:hypothetical protein ACRAWF_47035 [Streptomyces sp. L7]